MLCALLAGLWLLTLAWLIVLWHDVGVHARELRWFAEGYAQMRRDCLAAGVKVGLERPLLESETRMWRLAPFAVLDRFADWWTRR